MHDSARIPLGPKKDKLEESYPAELGKFTKLSKLGRSPHVILERSLIISKNKPICYIVHLGYQNKTLG